MHILLYVNHHELPGSAASVIKVPWGMFNESCMRTMIDQDGLPFDRSPIFPILLGLERVPNPRIMAHVSVGISSPDNAIDTSTQFWVQISTCPPGVRVHHIWHSSLDNVLT